MNEQEQLGRACLRDLEQVDLKEFLKLRERVPASVSIWTCKQQPKIALVQLKLRKSWWQRLIPENPPGRFRYPWKDDIRDSVLVHKIERLLCENGQPGELIRLDIGSSVVIQEAMAAGFLREIRR